MGNYTQRELSGSMFKNKRKRDGRKDPDYTGSVMIDGQEYWLDGWIKNAKSSPEYDPEKETWISVGLRAKEGRGQAREPRPAAKAAQHAPPPPPPPDPDLDPEDSDEIPF